MAATCKLVVQIPIKSRGKLFHEMVSTKPQSLVNASKQFSACHIHGGDDGLVGRVTDWHYIIDGKNLIAKTVVENVDMEKSLISYKWSGGDLLDLYKHFVVTIHVETKQGAEFLAWTLEYEPLKPDTPHPLSLVKLYIDLTAEMEAHLSA